MLKSLLFQWFVFLTVFLNPLPLGLLGKTSVAFNGSLTLLSLTLVQCSGFWFEGLIGTDCSNFSNFSVKEDTDANKIWSWPLISLTCCNISFSLSPTAERLDLLATKMGCQCQHYLHIFKDCISQHTLPQFQSHKVETLHAVPTHRECF